MIRNFLYPIVAVFTTLGVFGQSTNNADYVKDNFTKTETNIVIRDGIKLYTIIYSPKDHSEK